MHLKKLSLSLALLGALTACGKSDAPEDPPKYQVGDRLPQPGEKAASAPGAFREIGWDALIPPGWDPSAEFQKLNIDALEDSDPRAVEAIEKMKAAWSAAPANEALNGQRVRIPGFIVPLEWGKDMATEFLMVPYFGACIHTPPPPANQIIHVFPDPPIPGLRNMDTVWVSGELTVERSSTTMGESTYRMKAMKVEPYEAPR